MNVCMYVCVYRSFHAKQQRDATKVSDRVCVFEASVLDALMYHPNSQSHQKTERYYVYVH